MEMTLAEEFKTVGENTTGKSKSMLFIKLTYWLGIGADALWAIGLLIPQVYAVLTGPDRFSSYDLYCIFMERIVRYSVKC